MSFTREQVEKTVKSKGYQWFENGDLNIVGIRNSSTGKSVTNKFDDWITVSYKKDGQWQFNIWPITTDPGTKAVKEYHNPNGVARLVPAQYKDSHMVGLHQGKYEALKQKTKVKVYRDKNKDMTFNETVIQEGVLELIFTVQTQRLNLSTLRIGLKDVKYSKE